MLENLLVPDAETGKLHIPVAGVVFHYDVNSSICTAEAASLCSLGIDVNVFVSKSNFHHLKNEYGKLSNHGKINVQPLLLGSSDLSVERILKLMAFDEKEGPLPLYMEVVQRLLREISMKADQSGKPQRLNYFDFKAQLEAEDLAPAQRNMLNMRLSLLESFMNISSSSRKSGARSEVTSSLQNLKPGSLTIIDLSDPFVNASSSCALFEICLSIMQQNRNVGLAIVLDEAHKFMNRSGAAESFTDRLLTAIREQRHNGTRAIIATQEPTISEKLLDLCSTSIIHRFSSPAWFEAIRKHLAAASRQVSSDVSSHEMFDRITALDTGESLVFSPSSFVLVRDGEAAKLRANVVKMKTRVRRSNDAGVSLLASQQVRVDG
jgi:hypothetical protein